MELGEKILQARLAAGLSQRQLCGDTITRNMLSQIEHGTAKPSMGTLQILAARLGKPVSYFLEEAGVVSPNLSRMENARAAFDAGNFQAALEHLEGYTAPDPLLDREYALLAHLSLLHLAEAAARESKTVYAKKLLEDLPETAYCAPELSRRKALLEASLGIPATLPSLDAELFLQAKAALSRGGTDRSLHLLEAMEDRSQPQWQLLRGEIYLRQGSYAQAAKAFHQAELDFPAETAPKLEECYRELGDFQMAYVYACKQKK